MRRLHVIIVSKMFARRYYIVSHLKWYPDLTTSNLEFHYNHVLSCRNTSTCRMIIIFELQELQDVVNIRKKFGQHWVNTCWLNRLLLHCANSSFLLKITYFWMNFEEICFLKFRISMIWSLSFVFKTFVMSLKSQNIGQH